MRYCYEVYRDEYGIYNEIDSDGPFDCGIYTTHYEFVPYGEKPPKFTEKSLQALKLKVKNYYEKSKS